MGCTETIKKNDHVNLNDTDNTKKAFDPSLNTTSDITEKYTLKKKIESSSTDTLYQGIEKKNSKLLTIKVYEKALTTWSGIINCVRIIRKLVNS